MIAVNPPLRPHHHNEEVLMAGDEQEESDLGELFAEDNKEDGPEVVDVGEGNDDDKGDPEDQDCEGAAARVPPCMRTRPVPLVVRWVCQGAPDRSATPPPNGRKEDLRILV